MEDLQVYRIVTGQTNAEDYVAILDKYGWDDAMMQRFKDRIELAKAEYGWDAGKIADLVTANCAYDK